MSKQTTLVPIAENDSEISDMVEEYMPGQGRITLTPRYFSLNELYDIAFIKSRLLDGKNQLEIAEELGITGAAVTYKINKWMRTNDFSDWCKNFWLKIGMDLINTERGRMVVHTNLTRLMIAQINHESKSDSTTALPDINEKFKELISFGREQRDL
jgi:hypothetical protein